MLLYGTMDFMVYGSPCCLGAGGAVTPQPQIGLRPLRGACTAGRGGRERQALAGGPHLPKSGWEMWGFIYVRIVWKMDIPATLTFLGGEREREHDKYPEDFLANRFWDSDLFADGDDSRWSLCPVLGTSWRTKVISSRVFASVSQPEGGLRFQTGNPRFS